MQLCLSCSAVCTRTEQSHSRSSFAAGSAGGPRLEALLAVSVSRENALLEYESTAGEFEQRRWSRRRSVSWLGGHWHRLTHKLQAGDALRCDAMRLWLWSGLCSCR